MIRPFVMAAIVAALVSAACTEPATVAPPRVLQVDDLELDLVLDRTVIAVGDSSEVTMRLRNLRDEPRRLRFGSGCQIMPYIERTEGTIQMPGGGHWTCTAVLTTLDVPALGSVTRSFVVRGVEHASDASGRSLPPGGYRAYAVLALPSESLQLRSPTVEFEVR
jgi:hypothetical protein